MTSVAVPKFVMALMENEIVSIIEKTLEAVGRCSNVPIERLRKEVEKDFDLKLRVIPIEEEELKIIRSRPRRIIPDDCRCNAQVKKGGLLKPCSFARIEGSSYCKRHDKKYGEKATAETPSNASEKSKIVSNPTNSSKAATKLRKVY
jgi:hypothetical protein